MTPKARKNKRLVGLFLLGCLLFNYPLLSLFNLETMILGIPLLFFYIYPYLAFSFQRPWTIRLLEINPQ